MRDATVTALPLGPTLDDDVPALLRAADRLIARAMDALATQRSCLSGAPEEMVLRLEGRRARWDARDLSTAAGLLQTMPALRAAFHSGLVSWSQVRAITRAMRTIHAQDRPQIDTLIEREAARLRDADPEVLLDLIDSEIDRIRFDLAQRREQHAIDTSFLVLQPRVDGSGGSIYGETDTEGFAAIAHALDTAAPRPTEEPGERAHQRMDALINICERSLAGGSNGTRPRPRLLATVDLADLVELGASESARVLWQVAGRRGRITLLTTSLWACDADITPIIFDRSQPIGIGDTRSIIPPKIRTALIARDQGCRFLGCNAPTAWTDARHIIPRSQGGTATITNLVLLCRRCHRRIHTRGWTITLEPDGTLRFTWRARTWTSPPPRRE